MLPNRRCTLRQQDLSENKNGTFAHAYHRAPRRYACTKKHIGHTCLEIRSRFGVTVIGKSRWGRRSGASPRELPVRRRRRRRRRSCRRATMTVGGRSAANRVCRRVVRTSTRIRAGTWRRQRYDRRGGHGRRIRTVWPRRVDASHGWRYRRCVVTVRWPPKTTQLLIAAPYEFLHGPSQ